MEKGLKDKNLRGKLERGVSLARFTSWKVGGAAEILFQPEDLADLQKFIKTLDVAVPITWLGRGTNVLVRDGGVRGVVIIMQGCINKLEKIESNLIRAELGVSCAKLARFGAENDLIGAEFLAGIPGTVGGALAMNSGAYGSETWNYVAEVETLDRNGELQVRRPNEFEIGYRSVNGPDDEWFIAATFKFETGDGQQAKQKIRELLDQRNASQPVGNKSCGSVFRNPENDFAARLIESCELKGKTIGGAQISTKHANFILNMGDATAADIEALILNVRSTIKSKCGVSLIPEVRIIGEAA
ncbi:MAG: UDP-N-acetylmuramate dehydrogenase [Gammaproteobacteria bacterium]|nr:MAG: UDP-N-acetylmuramate dehydrogenase [Gammaproteobacteria bacterium]